MIDLGGIGGVISFLKKELDNATSKDCLLRVCQEECDGVPFFF
jgi:hypothetical protein